MALASPTATILRLLLSLSPSLSVFQTTIFVCCRYMRSWLLNPQLIPLQFITRKLRFQRLCRRKALLDNYLLPLQEVLAAEAKATIT